MKLIIKKKSSDKVKSRLKKKVRVRKKVTGSNERPRLCVFKSTNHIYAQIISDESGKTILSSSSVQIDTTGDGKSAAKQVGASIAKLALSKNIKQVVFDRNGYLYHGRVKSLADGAREAGLSF